MALARPRPVRRQRPSRRGVRLRCVRVVAAGVALACLRAAPRRGRAAAAKRCARHAAPRVAAMIGKRRGRRRDRARRRVPAGARPRRAGVRRRSGCSRRPRSPAGPSLLAAVRLFVGAAFLGAVSDAMLLGHWYLVQPGLRRDPVKELVRVDGRDLALRDRSVPVADGHGAGDQRFVDDGYDGLLGWVWLTCAVTTIGLVGSRGPRCASGRTRRSWRRRVSCTSPSSPRSARTSSPAPCSAREDRSREFTRVASSVHATRIVIGRTVGARARCRVGWRGFAIRRTRRRGRDGRCVAGSHDAGRTRARRDRRPQRRGRART